MSQQGDVRLFQTNDGGEITVENGLVEMSGGLETCAFVDMGNVIRFQDEAKLRDYRFGIGTGLRFRTPLGPIRVDWGWNPNPRDYEDDWAVFLAVGYPF